MISGNGPEESGTRKKPKDHKNRAPRHVSFRVRTHKASDENLRARKQAAREKRQARSKSEPQENIPLNENRYARIIASSMFPPWGLFRASLREDHRLIFPRLLRLTFDTSRRIPKSLFMPKSAYRDRYVFETFDRWGKKACKLCQVRLEIKGREHIDPVRTYLFVVNHSSPADIPVMYAALPVRAAFVANAMFSRIPIFSYWMKLSGAVFVEQKNPAAEIKSFRQMVRRLKKGRSLILFPEGHIYQGTGIDKFKRGGITAALFAHVPIIPVCMYGTQDVIFPGSLHAAPRKKLSWSSDRP
jgi:1-acyl-sn-glycerol-3-phosphate acyltransferase